ncbi:unnamed protein product [Urochloa decumbens]|uniref:Uncharacterized protein n=1 Tax=Urochloa decumbens TaxID=240449 RepID=A0ABC9F630_9POAL
MIASFGSPPRAGAHKSPTRPAKIVCGLPPRRRVAARAATHGDLLPRAKLRRPHPSGGTHQSRDEGWPVSTSTRGGGGGDKAVRRRPCYRPGRRFRPRVPMTKEEEEKLVEVTVRHMSGRKELQARIERRDELRKRLDEVLFQRRCWAATMANHVFALRADVARARQQKEGTPLPEELEDAQRRSRCAFIMNEHIGRALDMGLDAFADDYCKFVL